jgi:signal transduction histidine kinase
VDRIRSAIDAEEPVSIDLRNYRKDGTEFWNHLEIAPVRNSEGEVVNYIGFQQDVTGRKERQRQLEILDRVLRHNLRNEVGVIRSQAETIQHSTSGDVATGAKQIIDKTAELEALTEKERRITQLLQENASQMAFELEEIIKELISDIGSKYPQATLSVEECADVTLQASQFLPEAIQELVTNAIVHNDSDPDVAISVTQTDDTVQIAIADNGPRIPEEERTLSTSDAEPTPLYHGSGLGLWLVTLIVERSGGRLAFKENAPTGNIVEIELPH